MNTESRGQVAVVVGNPRLGSRTAALGSAVGELLRHRLGSGRIEVIEVAALGGGVLERDDPGAREAEETVLSADADVVASPVYKASYSGLCKVFLDRFAAGALAGRPTAPVMLGGSSAHQLAVEVHLRPVLTEIGGTTLPGCYLTEAELSRVEESLAHWWNRAGHYLSTPEPSRRRSTR